MYAHAVFLKTVDRVFLEKDWMIRRFSPSALGFFGASAVAALWLVGRDALQSGLFVGAFLLGGVTFCFLPVWVFDGVATLLPASRQLSTILHRLALTILCVSPPIGALVTLKGEAFDQYPWAIPAYLVFGCFAVFAHLKWSHLLAIPADPRYRASSLIASLQLSLLMFLLHYEEGTFLAVRQGRLYLHHLLFAITYLASIAAFPLLSLRIWYRTRAVQTEISAPFSKQRTRLAWCALGAIAGLALIEADRRALPDLYDGVHRWLAVVGVLCLDSAISTVLPVRRTGGWIGTLLLLVMLASMGVFFSTIDEEERFSVRAEVVSTAIGTHLLRLRDALVSDEESKPSSSATKEHPALDFDRYHDYRGNDKELNILLIVADGMRADELDQKHASRLPRMTALARESVKFTNARAPATRTIMSMSSLLTGRYSAHLDWHLIVATAGKTEDRTFIRRDTLSLEKIAELGRFFHQTNPTMPQEGTLAERLQRTGRYTIALPYVGRGLNFRPGLGFERGFNSFPDLAGQIWPTPTSTRLAKTTLANIDQAPKGQPWFHWTHLFDPHESKVKHKYRTLVEEVDKGVGLLIDGLKSRGLYNKTVIVLTADHGEGFGEHRQRSHASSLYEEQVRIPILIRIPQMRAKESPHPVSLIDVTATLLALTNGEMSGLDGVNLLPLIVEDRFPSNRPVFLELHRWRGKWGQKNRDMKGVVHGDWKLIHDRERKTLQLFNLRTDPGEKENLLRTQKTKAKSMKNLLDAFVNQAEQSYPLPDPQ